jgi:DNA-binding transcriptional LysR family regulator
MNYTLNQLRIFLQVSESQSVTRAAEALFLTQPAVSIQLKKLQQQFSIPLTEVIGRQLFITDFGREIAKAAEKILNEVEAINYQSMAYKQLLTGKLKISVASTGKYVMPYFLSEFINAHRGVDLVMDVTNKTLVVKSLIENEVDFSLVSVVPEGIDTHQISLLQNRLYLIGSTKFKNKKPKKSRDIFKEYPLLLREQGSATRRAMEQFIDEKDLPYFKKIELTSNEAVKQSVIAGLGYSIMPLIGLKDALNNQELEIIPFKDLPIITTWNLIWLKAKKLSPAAAGFLEHLEAEKERIRQENFDWYDRY